MTITFTKMVLVPLVCLLLAGGALTVAPAELRDEVLGSVGMS